jgi:hypothetical protein
MILNIENFLKFTKKLLTLIKELSKVAGYKSNKQTSIIFLYIDNEQTKSD